jgi:radical SAM superfamily enzyme YgiQ (UPF0313 family)
MASKVLLVNGPSQDACDRFFGWPTSLLYAVAPVVDAAKRGDLDVEFVPQIFDPVWYVEGRSDGQIKSAFEKIVREEKVDMVCASAIYDSLYPTLRLLEVAKRTNPEIVNLLGGPHFDEVHDLEGLNDVKLKSGLINFGIAGDGEYALLEVLRSISRGKSLSDVGWNDVEGKAVVYDGKGVAHKTSGRPIELDKVPFMPLELADQERHRNDFDIFIDNQKRILPAAQMIASRGCPYECFCCSENRTLAYPNARSIENILSEIELRRSQGFKAIFFDDSTFAPHPQHLTLLRNLGKTGMAFGCLNRFNHLHNQEVVGAYRDAGFVYVYCAIEQFNDNSLKQMDKHQHEKQIEESMKLLSKAGLKVGVSLLWGLPHETEASIKKTLDFTEAWVNEGTIKLVSESVLSFHPGTAAGRGKVREGFHRVPPNLGFPFNEFEEGQWYH